MKAWFFLKANICIYFYAQFFFCWLACLPACLLALQKESSGREQLGDYSKTSNMTNNYWTSNTAHLGRQSIKHCANLLFKLPLPESTFNRWSSNFYRCRSASTTLEWSYTKTRHYYSTIGATFRFFVSSGNFIYSRPFQTNANAYKTATRRVYKTHQATADRHSNGSYSSNKHNRSRGTTI